MQRRTFLLASAALTALSTMDPMLAAVRKDFPLLAPWKGPYGGVPDFAKVKLAEFKPAMLEAIARNRAEIEKIASNKAPPTFANTIAALEDAGRLAARSRSSTSIPRR